MSNEEILECTSINHCQRMNHQIDHGGTLKQCLKSFLEWCNTYDVIWARMFIAKTGDMIASFEKESGLFVFPSVEGKKPLDEREPRHG